jgi:predicted nucleic acid-binding Zn ribbon protein
MAIPSKCVVCVKGKPERGHVCEPCRVEADREQERQRGAEAHAYALGDGQYADDTAALCGVAGWVAPW